jgi:hypothetical protein
MLMWHGALWLIDHGSTLYFHHSPGWETEAERARAPFERIRDHVLLRHAASLAELDQELTAVLTSDVIDSILKLVPAAWLVEPAGGPDAETMRASYLRYFVNRLVAPRRFVEEARGGR